MQISETNPLLDVLSYTEDQRRGFHNEQNVPGLQVPCDDYGHFITIDPWQVWSVYESIRGKLYHLHPELADADECGMQSICVCPTCLSKLEKGCIPPLY